jgi:hypothetical protein
MRCGPPDVLAVRFGTSRIWTECVSWSQSESEAANNGERDPIRLHWQAVVGFNIDNVSMPVDSIRRVPVYAPIARLG